jgi:hypothetical protein
MSHRIRHCISCLLAPGGVESASLELCRERAERMILKMASHNIHMDFAWPLWSVNEKDFLPESHQSFKSKSAHRSPIQAGLRGLSQNDCGREFADGPTGSLYKDTGAGTGNLAHAGAERVCATLSRRLFRKSCWLRDGRLQGRCQNEWARRSLPPPGQEASTRNDGEFRSAV